MQYFVKEDLLLQKEVLTDSKICYYLIEDWSSSASLSINISKSFEILKPNCKKVSEKINHEYEDFYQVQFIHKETEKEFLFTLVNVTFSIFSFFIIPLYANTTFLHVYEKYEKGNLVLKKEYPVSMKGFIGTLFFWGFLTYDFEAKEHQKILNDFDFSVEIEKEKRGLEKKKTKNLPFKKGFNPLPLPE